MMLMHEMSRCRWYPHHDCHHCANLVVPCLGSIFPIVHTCCTASPHTIRTAAAPCTPYGDDGEEDDGKGTHSESPSNL